MPSTTDNLLAKGMEAVKEVKATLEGFHGVFRTLTEQHGEVTAMLKRVQKDNDKRDELWPKIRQELLSHERGEVRVLYPELRKFDATRDLADEHDMEADELENKIAEIDAAPIGEFGRVFDELVDLVEQHVKLEESTIFPKADDVLGEDRARALDDEFLAAKRSAIETA